MHFDSRVARPSPVRELLLVAGLFLVYKLGRQLLAGDVTAAYTNASHIWTLERAWRLPSEAAVQQLILGHDLAVRAANIYYAFVHFPAAVALLVWTYLRRPDLYRLARTTLALLTAAALVLHILIPLAPPRLLPAAGMVDTGNAIGPGVYTASTNAFTNQYAAMPSLHVGWAAVIAIVLVQAGRTRRRWLWTLHPLVTLAVVVVTGNHYWLDAAAALVMLAAIMLLRGRRRNGPALQPVPQHISIDQG